MLESGPLIKVLWKDHASTVAANLLRILDCEQFSDVHIRHVSRSIAAHRVVLAANSGCFRERLQVAPAGPITVELASLQCHGLLQSKGHGTVFAELELILRIVYHGWADIREKSIASLLETARCLQFADICEVLQRTAQARAPPPPSPSFGRLYQQLGLEASLNQLAGSVGGDASLGGLHEVLAAAHHHQQRHYEPAPAATGVAGPPQSELLVPAEVTMLPPPPPPSPPPPPPPLPLCEPEERLSLSPADSGLCHQDVTMLTAAEVRQADCPSVQPGLAQPEPALLYTVDHDQVPTTLADGAHQQRLNPAQDGAPLLRVRTQFDLHCPWGVDMELAGHDRLESDSAVAACHEMMQPLAAPLPPLPPPPPPPPPPPLSPPVPLPLLPHSPLPVEEQQAIIEGYSQMPNTPETLEHFNENDFSGLTEEEKSPMPVTSGRVRRVRRRAPRTKRRRVPELISLDQSTVCQVCHRDLGRMSALQRHLASAHPEHTPVGGEDADDPAPPSTVDASAISDPRDTCAGLLNFPAHQSARVATKGSVQPDSGVVGATLAPLAEHTAPSSPQTSAAAQMPGDQHFCDVCGFKASTEELLRVHDQRQHPSPMSCSHCELKFQLARKLYQHMRAAHPGLPDKLSQCYLCTYSSGRPSQVRRHLRDVHGQDDQGKALPLSHSCRECSFVTCSAPKLRMHVRRSHSTDKEFKCSQCTYSTVEKQALGKHVLIMHKRDRPYRCEICDFRASTLSHISRHRRSHTKERPHVCEACGARYADRRRLREHTQMRHCGPGTAESRPFVCHRCGVTFARRDNMLSHIVAKHPEPATS